MGFVVIWLITVLLKAFENLPQAEASRMCTHCIHGENNCTQFEYGEKFNNIFVPDDVLIIIYDHYAA
jgi:hypothetical protein